MFYAASVDVSILDSKFSDYSLFICSFSTRCQRISFFCVSSTKPKTLISKMSHNKMDNWEFNRRLMKNKELKKKKSKSLLFISNKYDDFIAFYSKKMIMKKKSGNFGYTLQKKSWHYLLRKQSVIHVETHQIKLLREQINFQTKKSRKANLNV